MVDMDVRAAFEPEWAELRPRLFRMLTGRGIAGDVADDIVQDAAIKLLSAWSRVDRDQPLWPLARTIALNCLRDHYRRVHEVPLAEIPDTPSNLDVEDHAFARARLSIVGRALGTLRPTDRSTLLELIQPTSASVNTSALKMARMRARQRLTAALEKTAATFGCVPLGWRRLQGWVQSQPLAEMQGAAASLAASAVTVTLVLGPMDGVPPRRSAEANVARDPIADVGETRSSAKVSKRMRKPFATALGGAEGSGSSVAESSGSSVAMTEDGGEQRSETEPVEPVRVGPARADANEGRGYRQVYVCTGEDSPDEGDDQQTSITVYDGSQGEDDPEPNGCEE